MEVACGFAIFYGVDGVHGDFEEREDTRKPSVIQTNRECRNLGIRPSVQSPRCDVSNTFRETQAEHRR
jgi:hypothetical protein